MLYFYLNKTGLGIWRVKLRIPVIPYPYSDCLSANVRRSCVDRSQTDRLKTNFKQSDVLRQQAINEGTKLINAQHAGCQLFFGHFIPKTIKFNPLF